MGVKAKHSARSTSRFRQRASRCALLLSSGACLGSVSPASDDIIGEVIDGVGFVGYVGPRPGMDGVGVGLGVLDGPMLLRRNKCASAQNSDPNARRARWVESLPAPRRPSKMWRDRCKEAVRDSPDLVSAPPVGMSLCVGV